MTTKTVYCAFETWGKDGRSATYYGCDAISFIEGHESSDTFATLHVFYSKEEFMASQL